MILALDLDDTLYPERSFVQSGFRAVAQWLAPIAEVDSSILTRRLDELLSRHGRGRTFDMLLAELGFQDSSLIGECLRTYREHRPEIDLFPGTRSMLQELSRGPLYLVTDGDPEVQQRKIDALGIEPYFSKVYRTWSWGRDAGKPSLMCFELIRNREHCRWEDLVYVGDDPGKDFVALRALGALTIRVRTGRFAHDRARDGFDAEVHVQSVTEVPGLLRDRRGCTSG